MGISFWVKTLNIISSTYFSLQLNDSFILKINKTLDLALLNPSPLKPVIPNQLLFHHLNEQFISGWNRFQIKLDNISGKLYLQYNNSMFSSDIIYPPVIKSLKIDFCNQATPSLVCNL